MGFEPMILRRKFGLSKSRWPLRYTPRKSTVTRYILYVVSVTSYGKSEMSKVTEDFCWFEHDSLKVYIPHHHTITLQLPHTISKRSHDMEHYNFAITRAVNDISEWTDQTWQSMPVMYSLSTSSLYVSLFVWRIQ